MRGRVHPEVRTIVGGLFAHLGAELRALAVRPAATLVVTAERGGADVEVLLGPTATMRTSRAGHRYAAAPLELVIRIADQLAPSVASALRESPGSGATWCLMLGPRGAAAFPVVWMTAPGGSA